MVAAATRRFSDPWRIRRLRNLGGVSERALHVWAVFIAVLFARGFRRSKDSVVRRETRLVAWAASVLARSDHSAIPGTLPVHLLLLSRRVLQGVLGRSAELRRW